MKKNFSYLSSYVPLLFLFGTWGIFFLFLIPQLFFQNIQGGISTFVWTVSGDWAMHLSQVQAFAAHGFFDVLVNNPIYSGSVTAYPFLINFFSGKIFQITGDLEFSMLFPLYLLFPFLLWGLYLLGYEITRNKWASVLGVFFIFLGGGTAIFGMGIDSVTFAGETMNFEQYSGFAQNTLLEENGYYWKSFFVTLLFPQRALFFGLTVGSFLLYFFLHYSRKNFSDISLWKIFSLGLGFGLLSIIHTHSFLFFALFGSIFFLFDIKNFSKYLIIGLGSLISSLPFLFLISQGEHHFEFLYHGRWMEDQYEKKFFLFWIQNWGLIFMGSVLLSIMILWEKIFNFFRKERKNINISHQEKIFLTVVLIFCIANIIQFQGNPWDNGKIFVWVWVVFIFSLLAKFFHHKIIIFLCSISILASGIYLGSQPFSHQPLQMFSRFDREFSAEFSQKISPDLLVLTPDYHLFFVPTLTPNSIVMGYRGWLGSYGIDYGERWRDIEKIFEGHRNAKNLLKKYKIDVVVIDERLLPKNFKVQKKFFAQNFFLIFKKEGIEVYDVREKK